MALRAAAAAAGGGRAALRRGGVGRGMRRADAGHGASGPEDWPLAEQRAAVLRALDSHGGPLVLGSGSTSRKALLAELLAGRGFDVAAADIDERALGDRAGDPAELVALLARAKADALRARLPASGVLLTADQVVVHDGRVLEKPTDEAEARAFVAGYARSPARTVGAIVATSLSTGATAAALDLAAVHLRGEIPVETVDALIAEGDVFKCAGGLMVEHPLVAPHVARVEGGQDSVMGLGLGVVTRLVLEVCGAA